MKSLKTLAALSLYLVGLLSCNNQDLEEENNQEFIEYNIDGEESVIILQDINASFNPNGENPWTNSSSPVLDIYSMATDFTTCFQIKGFLNNSDYLSSYNYHQHDTNTGFMLDDFSWFSCPDIFDINFNNSNIIFNLTHLGEVGEYIDISFSGSYEDYEGNPHTINGIVHVIRDE